MLFIQSAWAQTDEELLRPEQAYPASVQNVDDKTIQIQWRVADGYYLYKNKFRFSTESDGISLGEPRLPEGKIKQDEFFGKVEIYRGKQTIQIPYSRQNSKVEQFTVTAFSQGCADLGVCYPPHKQTFEIKLPAVKKAAAQTAMPNPLSVLAGIGKSLGINPSDDEFLKPDQAFQLFVEAKKDGAAHLNWTIADQYYLYKDKIKVSLAISSPNLSLGTLELPKAKMKHDEYFGNVPVYYNQVNARLPILNNNTSASDITLMVEYQGCAEAGLCYPPIKKPFNLSIIPISQAAAAENLTTPPAATAVVESEAPDTTAKAVSKAQGINAASSEEPVAEQDRLARFLAEKPLWMSALLFFALGIGLAFTPCVFPMIPILSGIIIGQGDKISTGKALSLSLAYVLAMALTYTVVGVIAGLAGTNLQALFQNPWILSTFAAVFVALSFSMFGFYELQMPSAVQSRLTHISNSQEGGTLMGAGIMGFLSALIVGPCVTAPLIGALIVIGQTGDAVLGGTALFALSMGMGTPLLAIGASAGKLLPKAGPWMDAIKAAFGVGLLAVAIWLLERVIGGVAAMLLWSLLFIISAIYMGAFDSLHEEVSGWRRFWKGAGLAMFIYGIILMLGSLSGSRDMLNPLGNLISSGDSVGGVQTKKHLNFTRFKTVEDFEQHLAKASQNNQAVMLDFYADWCVYCIQMEDRTFPAPGVQKALNNVILLQADVTANDDEDTRLLKHFGLIAPPAILFFDKDGKERRNYRVVGFMDAPSFQQHVEKALN
ncbi:MAG: protein-disulfide reductase DsbD [Gammaproteobacteria bacterium]|nr:MAG: protein-disulfide reductase DsbD [Gammaproteobacteria bacterium]